MTSHPGTSEARVVIESAHASLRVSAALEFLVRHAAEGRVVVVGRTRLAAQELVRKATLARGHTASAEAHTLKSLAGSLARTALAKGGTVPAGALTMEAVVARVLVKRPDALGRFAPIREEPGLPRALARTLTEARLERLGPDTLKDPSLARLLAELLSELREAGLCDPAAVLEHATAQAGSLDGAALLLLDAPCTHEAEAELIAALCGHAKASLVTLPAGDARARELLSAIATPEPRAMERPAAVEQVQAHLFSATNAGLAHDTGIAFFSAPGESREGAEIARRILALAAEGVPFDEVAVLLRSPAEYALSLEEALARARIPAYFARGTRRPDPSGRALLALLSCADEGLSATRFSEYLSLGELPRAESSGAPPPAWPSQETRVIADDEVLRAAADGTGADPSAEDEERDPESAEGDEDLAAPVLAGSLRAPKAWEKLLVDAAVIGGLPRWEARLAGFRAELTKRLKEEGDEEARVAQLGRDLRSLDVLRAFALPLLAELSELAARPRPLSEYARALSDLATRALRRPERVLAVLAELLPMGKGADVTLAELRMVLAPRLVDLTVMPGGSRHGRVYIAPIDEARGLAFRHVFVPGLVERGFPKKLAEDPMFLDRTRRLTSSRLVTSEARATQERLYLRLALGAASEHATFSYPRVDTELGRPKTPSFYALELVRAQTGELTGFEELAARANLAARARIGWPAPESPKDAIDESEHDLALLASLLYEPEENAVGTARYLLSVNPFLARALRFRAKRWLRGFSESDGLVDPAPEARAALDKHAPSARSFSPTALQNFASCPYRFYLYAVHKLTPRDEPRAIEEMDALQKGSFVHEVLYEFLTELREHGLLPMTPGTLDAARDRLDHVLSRVEKKFKDELCPAIDRVWEDGIAQIRADVREWLRREVDQPSGFQPAYFELSFGLAGQRDASDARSTADWVTLDCGLNLRGSIDLVEQHKDGTLRATDYKTGKKRAKESTVIGGGKILQPVLYALVLEKMFPEAKVDGGRLYYASSTGGFESVPVRLDAEAREGAAAVGEAVADALSTGFLPALPDTRECEYCDYKAVCGPYEGIRTNKKKSPRMEKLVSLRKRA